MGVIVALGSGRKEWLVLPGMEMTGSITFDDLDMLNRLPVTDVIEMFTGEGAQFAQTGFQVCTQNAGDIIHVPTDWQHLTLNHWTSASVITKVPLCAIANISDC